MCEIYKATINFHQEALSIMRFLECSADIAFYQTEIDIDSRNLQTLRKAQDIWINNEVANADHIIRQCRNGSNTEYECFWSIQNFIDSIDWRNVVR
jgi:hypothetical protein